MRIHLDGDGLRKVCEAQEIVFYHPNEGETDLPNLEPIAVRLQSVNHFGASGRTEVELWPVSGSPFGITSRSQPATKTIQGDQLDQLYRHTPGQQR